MNKQQLRDHWISGGIYTVLLVIGLASVLALFLGQSGFPEIANIISTACVFGVLFALFFLFFKGRRRVFILLGILGVWMLVGFLMRAYYAYGAEIASGYIAPYLSKITHLDFIPPAVPSFEEGRACADFCIYLSVPYAAFLAWAVVARKSCLLSLLGTAPLFALSYGNIALPAGAALAFLFIFWISMILQARVLRLNKAVRPGFSLVCIVLVAAVFLTLFGLFPQESYVPSPKVTGLRVDIANMAADLGYRLRGLRGFPSGVPLTSSDGTISLDTTGSIQLPDRTVLRVRSTVPHTIYLRGYSASIYTGHEWLQPDETALAQANIPFDPLMYLGENGVLNDAGNPNTITIEPDRTDSNFLFTPYLLTGIRDTEPMPVWQGDSYLRGDGQASYTFETFQNYGDAYISPQNENRLWYVQNSLSSADEISGTYEYDGHTLYYQIYADGSFGIWADNEDVQIDDSALQKMYDEIMASLDSTAFTGPDAAYIEYIANEYTQLPDGLKETLLEWWTGLHDPDGLSPEMRPFYDGSGNISNAYWQTAATLVAGEISQAGTYTTEPGPQPQNRDFVEYFLMESRKGYCTHFASATVAMLRALDIPARYVEGYIVGESSFGSDGWADVSAQKAHAWAEIWLPGIGWVPVESTPAGTAVSQLSDYTPGGSANSAQPSAPQPTPVPTDNAAPMPTPPPSGTAGGSPSGAGPWTDIFTVLIICGGAAAILLVSRQVRAVKRRRGFDDPESNDAALRLYGYLSELEVYGSEISQEAQDIALKARFSQHTVSAEELALLKDEAQSSRAAALSAMSAGKKIGFWFKAL